MRGVIFSMEVAPVTQEELNQESIDVNDMIALTMIRIYSL